MQTFNHHAIGSTEPGAWDLASIHGCRVEVIGKSREGRPIYGLVVGHGRIRVSIIAGSHADEPVGPRAAVHFACMVAQQKEYWAREIAQICTLYIVPHANPDGDARNSQWQHHPGDLHTYLLHQVRDLPGDDIEFGYPIDPQDVPRARPENLAIQEFLREPGLPYHMHASLHSMGIAEGAWFLACLDWVRFIKESDFMTRMSEAAQVAGLTLQDIDRKGEKGFYRIAPGFSTTPRSDAMKAYFININDNATADKFLPSSMEWIQSIGGNPLCIVSEIPMFEMHEAKYSTASPEHRPYFALKRELPNIRAALYNGNDAPMHHAMRYHGLRPVSWIVHRDLQIAYLREAIRLVSERRKRGTSLGY